MRVNKKVMNVMAKAMVMLMVMVMLMELIMVIVINQQWSNVTSHRTNFSRPGRYSHVTT